MKHCDCCNIDLSDSFQFCPSCTSSLSDSRRCSLCGELAKSHREFCASCGRALPVGASQTLRTSGSEIPVVQAESSIPQQAESFQHPFERLHEITISHSELRDQDPSGTKQNGRERNRTAVLDNSEAAQVPLNSTGSYESLYPATKRAQAITGLSEHDSERLISHVIPNQTIEASKPPKLALFQSYGPTSESSSQRRWQLTSVLGLVLLCLVFALGFSSWYWWSRRTTAPPSAEFRTRNEVAVAEKPSNSPITKSVSTIQAANNNGADAEFSGLRQRRINAKPSERSQIVSALEDAERTYPNDYRFPYERAKLTIVGVHAHDESFAALTRAAEIAIDNGKAELMVENLMADKAGDFRKLSHGHREWSIVEEALRNRDKAALKTLHISQAEDH